MAKNGFRAMDSDMHVFEPADLWQRYIDPKYLDRAPKGLNRSFRDLGIEVEGKILPIPRQPETPRWQNIATNSSRQNTAKRASVISTAFHSSKRWITKGWTSPCCFQPVH